jgi:hypothetical protein
MINGWMIARNAPHDRILPDTNVWLNAAFVSSSAARKALSFLRERKESLIIDGSTEQEALRVLQQRRTALGLDFDPRARLNEYIAATGAIRVPFAPPEIDVRGINHADRQVVRAAIHYGALLLTSDAPLLLECRNSGIIGQFPWNIITQAEAAPPVEEILRVTSPNKYRGTIFARTTPGGWAGKQNVGTFTVVDIENIGALSFDSRTADWLFKSSIELEVRLNYPAAGQGTTIVCVSYDLPGMGKRGTILLRAAHEPNHRSTSSQITLKAFRTEPGQIRIGSLHNGGSYWNGYLRHVTVSPDRMGAGLWKAITELPGAAPNPMDLNVLDAALEGLKVA